MNVLALETSTVACSVALASGDARLVRHAEQPREHTRLLLPMVRELLAEGGVESADLDAVVLGNGPGSFIGMRIAASVAQGLCFATGAKLVPVSSLATLAAGAMAAGEGDRVVVAQDAHMNEVYYAGFEAGDDGMPRTVLEARLQKADAAAEALPGAIAAGQGWERYPSLYEANAGWLGGRSARQWPRATELLQLGLAALERGEAVAPERLEPAYLRDRVATPPA